MPKYREVKGFDEGGEYVEKVLCGYTEGVSCEGFLPKSAETQQLLKAALALGPMQSIRQAVTRLAAHKHLASDEQQLALKLVDYTRDLAEFPEFVVHAVCDWYRRESTDRFAPSLAQMIETCRSLMAALRAELDRQRAPEAKATLDGPPPPRFDPDPPEVQARVAAWLSLSRSRNLTEAEFAAWNRGEMPPAEAEVTA